jgi:hypothetical protein
LTWWTVIVLEDQLNCYSAPPAGIVKSQEQISALYQILMSLSSADLNAKFDKGGVMPLRLQKVEHTSN